MGSRDLLDQWLAVHNQNKQRVLNEILKRGGAETLNTQDPNIFFFPVCRSSHETCKYLLIGNSTSLLTLMFVRWLVGRSVRLKFPKDSREDTHF